MNNSKIQFPLHLIPETKQKVYLAISGGLDSVVLFHLLQAQKVDVHLLHVNYNLRGEDSIADEKFIRELAKVNAVPLAVLNYEMKAHLAEMGGNLQNEARKIRYSFFQNYLSKEPNSILMTAHHFDDQMETFFMHLSRKSGIAGLSCMAEQNGNHWRPLLNFSKQELKKYVLENKFEWREDVSNQENKYLRNLWRNEWLPKLKSELPSLEESVRVLIQAFQKERNHLEQEFLPQIAEINKNKSWLFSDFDSTPEEGKYLIAKELGFRFSEYERLVDLRQSDKSKYFEIERLNLQIWNDGDAFSFQSYEIKPLPRLIIEEINSFPETFDKHIYYADKAKIKGEINLRHWQEGDRIASVGMKGSQLISDIIKDAKVPSAEKKNVIVVEDQEKILWCVGLKVGRLALTDSNSNEILRIRINE
jgi:tRNA(Ile)-lysidine synthase